MWIIFGFFIVGLLPLRVLYDSTYFRDKINLSLFTMKGYKKHVFEHCIERCKTLNVEKDKITFYHNASYKYFFL